MLGQWSERVAQIGPKLRPFKGPALILWGLVTLFWIIFEVASPRYERTLEPQRIEAYAGARYEMPLLHGLDWRRLFYLPQDDIATPTSSKLVVTEDGRQLGPPHALHQDIEQQGRGRYSHWANRIVFSTSDNSDPRTNGRAYVVSGKMQPYSLMRIIGVLGLFFGGLWAFRRYTPKEYARVRTFAPLLFDGGLAQGRPLWIEGAAAAAFIVATLAVYIAMLSGGYTTNLALAGYFPTSDGADYWGCANQLLDYGSGNFWCHRRPIYSMVLGGLTLVSGRNLEVVLYVQTALLGGCLYVYAREVAKWIGWLPAVLAAAGVLVYGWVQVIGMTMSELLGVCLGLIGAAMLLRAATRRSLVLALVGVFIMGLGQAVRPAAVFVLPALLVWVATMRERNWRGIAIHAGLAAGALVTAVLVHSMFVILAGGSPLNSMGNAAITLYGMTAGGDWMTLSQQHPELTAENAANTSEIIRLSFANIGAHPGVFLRALVTNTINHGQDLWVRLLIEDAPTLLLYVMGLGALLLTFRKSPRSAVVLAVVLGELASAAIEESSGGMRIWAATGAMTEFLPWLFALALIARWLMKIAPEPEPAAAPVEQKAKAWAMAGGPPAAAVAGFLVLALMPPIHAMGLSHDAPAAADASQCMGNEKAARVDLSRAAILLLSDRERVPATFPRRLSRNALESHMSASWYRDSVNNLPEAKFIRVVPDAPRPELMPGYYAPLDIALPAKGVVTLCVDDVQRVEIATFPFYRVMSVH